MSYFLKKTFIEKLNLSRRIVPLIDHEDLNDVLKYIDFMTKHNFHIFEYTLRRKDSIKHIEKIRKVFPNIVLGAGSVLERKTITNNETQIFIETPYRNNQLLALILKVLSPNTKLSIASSLDSNDEKIISLSVLEWRREKIDLNKKPTVFLIGTE